jgi:hypothetical protein
VLPHALCRLTSHKTNLVRFSVFVAITIAIMAIIEMIIVRRKNEKWPRRVQMK